ncbi:MAG: type 4 pilus major pilin [Gammaproteobacteria bacterium]|nr:type 4 pilus major pilin [Gammaproteobacteria bacterium]
MQGIATRRREDQRWPAALRGALRPRRGMNLTDNLFGLGLVAIGIVVILGLGLYGRSIYQEQRASLLLTQLVQAVTSTYQSTRNYGTGSLIGTLDGFGRLPEDFVVRTGGNVSLEHPWGGPVVVNGGPGGETNQFRIRFNELDNDICAAVAERSAGKTRGRTGLDEVRINGTVLPLPYDVARVVAECDNGNANNWVAWDYF